MPPTMLTATAARATLTVRALDRPKVDFANGPRGKALKRLEAARVGRLKRAGQSLMHTLKQADQAAREMFVQDLQDVTEAATEVLLRPIPVEEPTDAKK